MSIHTPGNNIAITPPKEIYNPEARASALEIEKNSSLITQAARQKHSLFKNLGPDIQAKIAALTGDSKVHNESESTKIARKKNS